MDFNGSDGFVYAICDSLAACDTATVTITVLAVIDAPVANDDTVVTNEDTPVTIDVAANDTDPDGNLDLGSTNNTCATCTSPSNGVLTNSGDGSFVYTPTLGFSGSDGFVYAICDSLAACDTATVTITVNDTPVADDDTVVTNEDTPVTIDVAANDTDADGNLDPGSTNNTCATCTSPSNGVLTNSGDGSFVYTPTLNFSGSDGFVYAICDSLAACDTATVTITVNDTPVANDDTIVTDEDTPVTIDVAANDTDVDDYLVLGFDQQHLCHLHKSQ